MNEEPNPEETKAELPAPESKKKTLTFQAPFILKAITLDANGITHRDVREAAAVQVEHDLTTEWSETEIDESSQVFKVRVTNQLNFLGGVIDVINDEILLENGFRLVETVPSAREYMEKVGQRVMVSFLCREDKQKKLFRIDRAFINLP